MNAKSLRNGTFSCTKTKVLKYKIENKCTIKLPEDTKGFVSDISKLGADGLIKEGSTIVHGDILYNTQTKAEVGGIIDSPT